MRLPPGCVFRAFTPARTPRVNGVVREIRRIAADDPDALKRAIGEPTQQQQLYEQMLSSNLAFYAAETIQGPAAPPYNGRFLIDRHHVAWASAINRHKRCLFGAARDHGKSYFASVAFPIWKADRSHPGSLIYIFSASQTLAEERLQEAKDQLEKNARLHHLLPNNRDADTAKGGWSKREIVLMSRGRKTKIRARGWGVRSRGGHPDYIIGDDILDDDALYSETKRRKATDYYFSVPSNMIVPEGQIVICYTPFHQADVYAKIRATGKYHCLDFPARNKDGEPLFAARYDARALKEKEAEIGAARFAREFMIRPMTNESSMFPAHLFEGDDVRLLYRLGEAKAYWDALGCRIYTGVDIALSAETGADWFVIFSIGVGADGTRYVVNITRERGLSFSRQKAMIESEYALLKPDCIYIEANQAQRFLPQEIIRTTILPIRYFNTSGRQPKNEFSQGMTTVTAGKHNIDRGVPSLRMGFENRKWRFPRGDDNSIDKTELWFGELQCLAFDGGRVVSVGEHDDLAMASWLADVGARLGGVAWEIGEEDAQQKPGELPTPRAMGARRGEAFDPDDMLAEIERSGVDPFGLRDLLKS